MSLAAPNVVTVICSYQKDDYLINSLKGIVIANAKNIFGNQIVTAWSKELNIVADLLYYGLTTAGSLQTLGEEYTNLIQVDHSVKVPSLIRRIVMIFFHTVLPFFLEKILNHLEKKLFVTEVTFLSKQIKVKFSEIIPKIRIMLVTIHRLHLSMFYLRGIYYTIAKRLTQIRYVKYLIKPASASSNFSFLGKLSIIQSIFMIVIQLYSLYSEVLLTSSHSAAYSNLTSDISISDDSDLNIDKKKCSLCLEIRKDTSVSTCGHLFCWSCIHEWVATKAQCPLCRQELNASQIVTLKNYF